jgi:hypothetical protein
MYTKISLRNAAIIVMMSVEIVACKKDHDPDPNSAGFKIDASEKLEIPADVKLPDNLPGGNIRVATFYATGVQKYRAEAVPGSSPVMYQWVLVAPRADLFDHSNKKVGTHYAGPTWRLDTMRDSIVAQKFSPEKKAAVSGSIDWLQLKPNVNFEPKGIFNGVEYVQRIATTGGVPDGRPANATETKEVEYTAIYRFSKRK